jgi:hypothetical protein
MLLAAEERQWSDQEDKPKRKKNPPADVIARAIAEEYSGPVSL